MHYYLTATIFCASQTTADVSMCLADYTTLLVNWRKWCLEVYNPSKNLRVKQNIYSDQLFKAKSNRGSCLCY